MISHSPPQQRRRQGLLLFDWASIYAVRSNVRPPTESSNILPTPRRRRHDPPASCPAFRSAMSDLLVRDALDRTFLGAHRGPRKGFDHLARSFGIRDPFRVELVGTGRDPAIAVARIDHAGIAAMHQLEEVVLRLAGLAGVADQRLGELGVLHAVILLAAFAERAAVEADDRR